jgi:hypothetical protein
MVEMTEMPKVNSPINLIILILDEFVWLNIDPGKKFEF